MSFAANIFASIHFFFCEQTEQCFIQEAKFACQKQPKFKALTRADPHLHALQFPMQICTTPQAEGSVGA